MTSLIERAGGQLGMGISTTWAGIWPGYWLQSTPLLPSTWRLSRNGHPWMMSISKLIPLDVLFSQDNHHWSAVRYEQEKDFTSWNIPACNSTRMLYRESTEIKSRIRSLQRQQHKIIPNLRPKGTATQEDRMCWCRCTALQDNYWTILQELDSRVLCLKPKEEINPDGANKLKAKKKSSLPSAESLKENQHTFAILLLQCKYKYRLQNALLSIQTDWGMCRRDCAGAQTLLRVLQVTCELGNDRNLCFMNGQCQAVRRPCEHWDSWNPVQEMETGSFPARRDWKHKTGLN